MDDGKPTRRIIDGRFELEARLGGGGMGTVWQARDLVLDRAVALKEVRPPDPALAEYDPDGAALLRARVLREARALARVDHPNVVTIHHVVDGDEHAYPWIVMELVTGGSLQDRFDKGPLAPAEAARLGREVLAALRAAHSVGIQHRDVKPANVLMRPDGRPVLTDFGIAAIRESTALTATGSIIGTPDYMAPERISGNEGGPASDLWSLAMMLYVAVEGHHPLRRGTALATLAALLSEELPPPRRADELSPFFHAVLVKDPASRADTQTAQKMLTDASEGRSSTPDPHNGLAGRLAFPSASPSHPTSARTAAASYRLPKDLESPPGLPHFTMHDDARPRTQKPSTYSAGSTVRTSSRQDVRTMKPIAIAATATAAVLAGTLIWTYAPLGDNREFNKTAQLPASSATETKPTPPVSPRMSHSVQSPHPDVKADLLTPAGLEDAIAAIKAETGTGRACDLTVYSDYVSVEVLIKGSESKYDSYTYRPGRGIEKGIISGALVGGKQPFNLDDFNWNILPGLLRHAKKSLNVKQPVRRYLLVRPADSTFGTPLGLAIYLADDHVTGYLESDLKGKVTRVMPAQD
ncbi:serine/threonine-protein kinase [Streptomyces sp. NPDC086783]|uniref:serine/threonine-protein kinase n=1 Tax=Streptomyces sp. NPDC086783 TaxID=3365758 RepID=UPI00382085CA